MRSHSISTNETWRWPALKPEPTTRFVVVTSRFAFMPVTFTETDASLPAEGMCSVSIVTHIGQSGSWSILWRLRMGSVWHTRSTLCSSASQSMFEQWLHVGTTSSSLVCPPPHAQHMSIELKSSSS